MKTHATLLISTVLFAQSFAQTTAPKTAATTPKTAATTPKTAATTAALPALLPQSVTTQIAASACMLKNGF